MAAGSLQRLDTGPEACFLASCLAVCLLDIEDRQPRSAALLRFAMQRLRRPEFQIATYRMQDVPRVGAIAPFLRFLLPEIEVKSPQAARAVRGALRHLQAPEAEMRSAGSATVH